MKTTRFPRLLPRAGWLMAMALLCLTLTPHARAASLLLADTTMITGTGSQAATLPFQTPGAGTVTWDLQNIAWPQQLSLSALSFAATSSNSVLTSWTMTTPQNEQVAQFQVTSGGNYFAHIMATANNTWDLGVFSLNMVFTPTVPLPGSEWMLLIGVLVLFGLTRVLSAFSAFETFRKDEAAAG
jgi:hypothetical protein